MTVELYIIHGTPFAVCVAPYDRGEGPAKGTWLPRSQITFKVTDPGRARHWPKAVFDMPNYMYSRIERAKSRAVKKEGGSSDESL